jgi:hypothetical protein
MKQQQLWRRDALSFAAHDPQAHPFEEKLQPPHLLTLSNPEIS